MIDDSGYREGYDNGYKFALERIAERLKEMGFTEVDEFMEQFYDIID